MAVDETTDNSSAESSCPDDLLTAMKTCKVDRHVERRLQETEYDGVQ